MSTIFPLLCVGNIPSITSVSQMKNLVRNKEFCATALHEVNTKLHFGLSCFETFNRVLKVPNCTDIAVITYVDDDLLLPTPFEVAVLDLKVHFYRFYSKEKFELASGNFKTFEAFHSIDVIILRIPKQIPLAKMKQKAIRCAGQCKQGTKHERPCRNRRFPVDGASVVYCHHHVSQNKSSIDLPHGK